jgi:hypothetical protein
MLDLSLVVHPSVVEGVRSEQRLQILVNGVDVYSGCIAKAAHIGVRLSGNSLVGDELAIQFIHATPVAPAEGGESKDTRPLAFFFQALTLSVVDGAPLYVATQPRRQTAAPPEQPAEAPVAGGTMPDEVRIGLDGWLFLTGGRYSVLRYYTDAEYFTEIHAAQWADLLAARHTRLAAEGICYLHLAAPDKISVYPDYLGMALPNFYRHPIRMLSRVLGERGHQDVLIDPLDAFARHPNRDRLYLKTDTHWSYYAGQVALELVTRRIGQPRQLDMATREVMLYRRTLDLGSKLRPPIDEENFAVVTLPTVQRQEANELARRFMDNVRAGKPVIHGGINVVFRNSDPSAIQQTLMIFGDSFMDFQDSNATVVFAENFREVHFIWSGQLDYSYIARVRPQLVLSECAERFMIAVPKDDNYNVVRDAADRLLAYPA